MMDRLSLYGIAWILLSVSVALAIAVFWPAARRHKRMGLAFGIACVAAICIAPVSRPIFTTIYDRLLFKQLYPQLRFAQAIESRSGMVGVTPDGVLFGGGVYDGRFNTDLLRDTNIIVRPYAASAFHVNPSHVLMIGLGSGSWAQVIANNPQVQALTIVDINHGYLQLIATHQATASLLHNPKVTIVIDDGRRWLLRHPQAMFDLVVMNTSYHWRNHASNLLSADFLRIVRPHLAPKGVFFYNTTYSEDVVATGLSVYPYGLRIYNCIALSDSPLVFDRARWKSVLLNYVIDGKPLINPDDPEQLRKLDKIVNVSDAAPTGEWESIETNEEMRLRLKGRPNLIITDDNMGLEWR
jgi:SAM-dependent methyltransferase